MCKRQSGGGVLKIVSSDNAVKRRCFQPAFSAHGQAFLVGVSHLLRSCPVADPGLGRGILRIFYVNAAPVHREASSI